MSYPDGLSAPCHPNFRGSKQKGKTKLTANRLLRAYMIVCSVAAGMFLVFNYVVLSHEDHQQNAIDNITSPDAAITRSATAIPEHQNDVSTDDTTRTISFPIAPEEDTPNKTALLGCNDLKDVTIVRTLGKGHKKAVYEVKLPSGESAVIKRNLNAVDQRYFDHEAFYLKKMHELYGDQTIKYFGECNVPYRYDEAKMKKLSLKARNFHLNSISSNFTGGGLSYVIQSGQPLVTKWEGRKNNDQMFRQCLASYFTSADLENFRSIARQYAAIPDHRLFFAKPGKWNSHVFAEQYALMDGPVGIRHIDLDDLYKCQNCSFDEVLEFNCETVRRVTFTPKLNCSEGYSLKHPVKDMNDHINSTEANAKCAMHRE